MCGRRPPAAFPAAGFGGQASPRPPLGLLSFPLLSTKKGFLSTKKGGKTPDLIDRSKSNPSIAPHPLTRNEFNDVKPFLFPFPPLYALYSLPPSSFSSITETPIPPKNETNNRTTKNSIKRKMKKYISSLKKKKKKFKDSIPSPYC